MLLRSISRILWVVVWFAVAAVRASAAGVVSHQPITQHTAEAPVVINAVVSSPVDVAGVNLFYRLAGEDGYIDVEMDRTVEGWRAEIPLDYLTPAGVEYFISATLADGTTVTFPEDDPENAPVRVDVLLPSGSQPPGQPEETVEVPVQPAIGEKAILIFSPVPESKVPFDAVLISASLFHIDSVDVSSVRLLVDGQDVTPRSSVGADLVIYEPASMTPGIHRVRIDVKTVDGRVVEPKVWSFVVTKKLEAEVEREFTYRGRVNGGYSLDAIEGKQLSIGMTAASLSGQWRGMRFKSDLKLTSEEDPFKQPRNRYRFSLDAGKYLSLSLGDFNSRISRFTLDGKRVRGVDFDLKLGWVNLHVVKGELDRTVQGRLDPDESLFLDQIEVERGELDTTRNNIIYRLNRKGFTFQKDITAARLSFGGGKKFQLGFNWLKAKDDITSVDRFLTDALITVTQDSSGPIPLDITPGEYSYGDLRGLIDSRENYSLL
ncbi:MAG: hypothetical protein ACE5GH_02075, partial [Fidelibacterota bacterium]